ncbi:DUF2231 domain-containing protein [Streptomyces sp. NPDC059447]|uniref:DUF2231 domain-containing protein n=1 Tax=Streptomyces sp. NPDC059447 TaxID=3346834 RepID=UPI0036A5F7BC
MTPHSPDTSPTTGQPAVLDTASAWWLTTLDRLERTAVADPAIRVLQRGIRSLPLGGMRDLLRGRPLGHPVHPVLVQVPIGCWLSASVLDVVPGAQRATTTLTAVGLAGVVPAAVAGWADWADLPPEQARVGLVHAVSNVAAVACYTASLTARLRGRAGEGAAVVAGRAGHRSRQRCAGRARRLPPGSRSEPRNMNEPAV